MNKMFFYTYVLKSLKDGKNYTGFTEDLKERVQEHQESGVRSTKGRRPLKLIYYEACLNEEDAKRREKYLKSTRGRRWLGRRLKQFNSNNSFN